MENEIMAVGANPQDAVVYDKSLEMIVLEAEKKVDVLKRVLGAAIKRTNPHDWTSLNDKPYLGGSGCEKIAPLFGVRMANVVNQRDEREDDKGRYYMYTFQGTFSWQGGSIEAIGACSSRDKFFGWDSGAKAYKELHDVDETNIKKAAYSNLMVNGITRLLGIRNLEWSDLEPFGITKEKVSKVEYNKGKETGGEKSSDFISEPQRKRLIAIASKAGYTPETLKEFIMYNFNISSTTEIPWKKYDEVCKKVEATPVKGAA